ncbi:alpha/beta hydrolase [Iodidimonas muriae]|uniref:Alpha/beta hydrolase n=1 Tax=Iodidimonas muriae TaxID=261467 RepID=A0ABQ2LD15_9PROT|nr:alpha/beta hydrolase [Iodidimonas muriae]GER07229.1 alpha/beta hydrolase [Kordiimonadales bacterium JCM 17843]GGO11423.1 alpha/beta hydrolase [Iodidimonas muriae]
MWKFAKWCLWAIAIFAVLLCVIVLNYGTPDLDRALLTEYYAKAPSRFLDLPAGGRIHYRDYGPADAPPVVLVHGSGSSLHSWEGWADSLVPQFRVITLDLPAHGLTGRIPGDDYGISGMTAAIDAIVDATGLERFVLGGNSMGGKMSIAYALQHPQKIAGLILIDSSGYYPETMPPRSVPLAFTLARTPVLRHLMTWITPRAIIRDGLKNVMADKQRVTETLVDRYWHLLLMEGSREAMMEYFATPDVPVDPSRIISPTLILWGGKDTLLPPEVGAALAEQIPQAHLLVYEDLGHIPMEEDPQRTAHDAMAFLSSLTDDTGWNQSARAR